MGFESDPGTTTKGAGGPEIFGAGGGAVFNGTLIETQPTNMKSASIDAIVRVVFTTLFIGETVGKYIRLSQGRASIFCLFSALLLKNCLPTVAPHLHLFHLGEG